MNNLKKIVLKQSGIMGHRLEESRQTAYRNYEVVGLENTVGYEIGEVLSKDDVKQLICKPNMKVVVK